MNYRETLEWMYGKLPMFTRIGAAAIKKDLTNTLILCETMGNPHEKFKSIHVAGTNGKGSVSHFMASILQSAGFKVGLYTSPHLLDFRERMRVNGREISEQNVIDFINKNQSLLEEVEPSFFEMTVAMAFDFFRNKEVDYAIIETGLGGRLDSTNIITPILSVITNISLDHQNLLGNSLEEIAFEKAGIIKPNIPVVIGKTQEEIKNIFIDKAKETNSPIVFADQIFNFKEETYNSGKLNALFSNRLSGELIEIDSPLAGNYQLENIGTVLSAISLLNTLGVGVESVAIKHGITKVKSQTGLLGRWEVVSDKPQTICDVAHNEAGLKIVFEQIKSLKYNKLRIVYGMVKDKDIEKALNLLPKNAVYYLSQPQLPRALDVKTLSMFALNIGLVNNQYDKISQACFAAQSDAEENDLILIVGSIFVVAEALEYFGASK